MSAYQNFVVPHQHGGLDRVVNLPIEGPEAEQFFDEYCNVFMEKKYRNAIEEPDWLEDELDLDELFKIARRFK